MKRLRYHTPNIERRFAFVIAALVVMMLILGGRLFQLTILQGEAYRDQSDNKRIKEIKVAAPRGNIYDRNGRLLAGTRPSFTVQLINDELRTVPMEEQNQLYLQLVRRLEEDGVSYQGDYDLLPFALRFRNDEDWLTSEKTPEELLLSRLLEQKLDETLLRASYTDSSVDGHFRLQIIQIAVKALEQKGIVLPLSHPAGGDALVYVPGKEFNEAKEKYGLNADDPVGDIVRLVGDDSTIFRKLLAHPVARKVAYDLLNERGQVPEIDLAPLALDQDLSLLETKGVLHRMVPEVTLSSLAKTDFAAVAKNIALPDLFASVVTEGEQTLIPAQMALDRLAQAGVAHGLSAVVLDGRVEVQFDNPDADTPETPVQVLAKLAVEHGIADALVTDDALKSTVQSIILNAGVNPRILVSTWEYVYEKERTDLTEALELEANASAEAIYAARNERYKIRPTSMLEAIGQQSLHLRIDRIGHYGYEPVNIAYNLSDDTVAYLEESIPNNRGVQITVLPIRYYPQGASAAHVLGYVGRIATEDELARYTEERGYRPNDIIGKTGIEESFEDVLHGQDGQETLQVDVMGNRTQTLSRTDPVPGNNVFLTIDYDLQHATEQALSQTLGALRSNGVFRSDWGDWSLFLRNDGSPLQNATSGATVVLDVKTGEVLAMANNQPYDPNLFATGISATDWESLFPEDERDPLAHRPLLNIATQSELQPGSIFKLVTSVSALNKGMNPYELIEDSGVLTIGDTDFGCWIWNESRGTHGLVDMPNALMHSCNYYFYALALGENQTTGARTGVTLNIEDIEQTTKDFGLNQATGIEIRVPEEAAGAIPDPVAKVATIRALMRSYLEEHLRDFEKPDVKKTNAVREEDVDAILNWLNEPQIITRAEVSRRLDELGYIAETPLEGQTNPLTDVLKFTYINQASWDITDTLNVVIGQGQNAYTPIQMANMVATIANGGQRNKTTLYQKTMNYDNSSLIESGTHSSEPLPLRNPEELSAVREGMKLAGSYGSVGQIFSTLPMEVGTKTGTAERSGINPVSGQPYDDYGWFVAFAPLDDPQIAVATVLFQGGSGSNAAPMTREIIANYFKLQPDRPIDKIEPSTEEEE